MPRGPEAEGRRDGRRPCGRVARKGELSLGRAREGLLAREGATALKKSFLSGATKVRRDPGYDKCGMLGWDPVLT